MATIRDKSLAYESAETLNISDLDSVSTEMELFHKKVNEGTDDMFEYDYATIDDKEYRVPKSVQKQLKAHLQAKPAMTKFAVSKSGKDMNTSYTVIPMD